MAKFGVMDAETEDCSRVNCNTNEEHVKNTVSKESCDEDDEKPQNYAKILRASLSKNEDESLSSEEPSENSDCMAESMPFRGDHKITTASSLIIESLLHNLCQVYIPDAEQSRQYYRMICQILYQMKIIDESHRMSEFEGMRNQYQRIFHHLLNAPVGLTIPAWPSHDVTNEWSHYHREFDEIEYIAGGGFGRVFLVKHKLDGTHYAVKKIVIRSGGIKSVMKYLSEVKTFATLNHANIVQYKAAWLELGVHHANNNISENSDDSDDSCNPDKNAVSLARKTHDSNTAYIYPDIVSTVDTSYNQQELSPDSSDFEINFQESQHYSFSTKSQSRVRYVQRQSISEGGDNFNRKGTVCTLRDIKNLRFDGRQRVNGGGTNGRHKWATLYIQMALCPMTLQQWLLNRNEAERNVTGALVAVGANNVRHETIMEILRQLLKGLKYIHSKKIVHHDIKPSNIFVQLDNGCILVQLGDFGLACPLQSARHPIAGGTKLYAAPEQIQGTCVSKSDMYSLGIILLELAASFRTDMERVHNITQLRNTNGQSAIEFLVNSQSVSDASAICQSQIATIISQVMVRAHVDRPDADGLLTILARMSIESDCTKVGKETPCNKLVKELRAQLAQKDAEIGRLRALLQQAGIPGDHANYTDD